MTSEPLVSDVRVGGRPIELAPHHCFACGTLNEHGLHLELHAGGDLCWVELALASRFGGWEGIAHGGIICTILDEVMAWAVVEHDIWGVTARMSVDFRRPVPLGRPLRAEGRVTSARRRIVDAQGVLLDAETGEILATSTGTYVGASDARKRELKARYGFAVADAPPMDVATTDDVATPGGVDEVPA